MPQALIIIELILRIWLRILETTPPEILAERQKDFQEDIRWWRKFLKLDEQGNG